MRLLLAGAAVALITTAAVATSSGWPARLPLHLALLLAAGLAWAATLALLSRIPRRRRDALVIAAIAVALRVPAWLAPPAHSDDVYRFAWDGRVARAGINPYRFAPAAPELAHLRGGAQPDLPAYERGPSRPTDGAGPLWARVNNADLPTIYPPVAQLAFAAAARLPLPPVAALKLLFALADLATALLLWRLLALRGADPRRAIVWAWSPLAAIEIGQDAHVDVLAIALLVAALLSWQRGRRALAGALLGLAAGAKLIPAPLLASFKSLRAWALFALAVALAALPFLSAGRALFGSTGEFARRWRGNDGAYALVQAATDRAVCAALHAPPVARPTGPQCDRPLDLWPREDLARVISGRDYRAAVYPDELSSFLARVVVGLLLAGVLGWALLRRGDALGGVEGTLGALLLLTPALHPWYALWILPVAALTEAPLRRAAWVALSALVALGYLPLAGWLSGQPWRDPIGGRLVEHGLCWGLLLADRLGVAGWNLRRRPPGLQSQNHLKNEQEAR